MKTRVLIIGTSSSLFGGISKYVSDLVNSPTLSKHYDLDHLETGRTGSEDIGLLSGMKRTVHQLMDFLRAMKKHNIDIVHIHTASFWSFWRYSVFILLSKLVGKKVLLHIHGAAFKEFYHGNNVFKRKIVALILRNCHALIVLSKHWETFFDGIVPDVRKYVVVNSVKVPSIDIKKHIEEKRNNTPPTKVLFLGLLTKRKGLEEILLVIPSIVKKKNVSFVVAGAPVGEEMELYDALDKGSSEYGDEFRLRPNVSNQEKMSTTWDCDIFLLPTYAEALPIALLEAMSYGLPVITTPVGAIPEVIEDGVNGFLIKPGDAKALSEWIITLIERPEFREMMGKNNIQRINAEFTQEKMIEKIDRIYQESLYST